MSQANDESLSFDCPKCGKRLRAATKFVGRRVKCPGCEQPVRVPGPQLDAPQSPASATPRSEAIPASAAPVLKPASDGEDWLNLDAPAIGDLQERTQAAAQIKQAKEEARRPATRHRQAAAPNQRPTTPVSQEPVAAKPIEPMAAKRRQEKAVPAALHDANEAGKAKPTNAPESSPREPLPTAAEAAPADSQAPRSVFDDDLPELAELESPKRANRGIDSLLAAHGVAGGVDGERRSKPKPAQPSNKTASTPTKRGGNVPSAKVAAPTKPKRALRPSGNAGNPSQLDDSFADELDDLIPGLSAAVGEGGLSNRSAASKSKSRPLGALSDELEDEPDGRSPPPADPDYRITCPTCGTAQYVALSTKGMKIKCPDCFSQFKVPPPPQNWKPPSERKKAMPVSTEPDVNLAAVEEMYAKRDDEKRRNRASQLLERAKQDMDEDGTHRVYEGDFDTAGFVHRTFGFLRDPIAVGQVIGYGVVFGMLFALAQFGINEAETGFGKGLLLMVVIGGPLIGMLFALPMLSGGLALLESVANREPRVTEWPGFNLFDNLGEVLAISAALMASLLPGFIIGGWLGGDLPGAGRIQITAMMVTTFTLFPFFLLSMLDNGSLFQPISNSVINSLREASEAWGGYFLKTLVAFSVIVLLWYLLLGKSPVLAGIAGFLLPLLVFFTCQQIGALADSISEHLSFEFAPASSDGEEEES